MDMLQNLASGLAHHDQGQAQGQAQQSGPPAVPPPWVARWDEQDRRWLYINEQTGERTFQHPQPAYPPQGQYPSHQYPPQGQYPSQGQYPPPQSQYPGQGQYPSQGRPTASAPPAAAKPNHGLAYGAVGVAAGLVGGALLMHEGEKIRT